MYSLFISSPEHKVLKGSFYDHLMSVVRRQLFLLTSSPPKLHSQFEPNLAGMFLKRSSLKLCAELDSIKNSGYYGSEMDFFKQFFKNLLLLNCWSNFKIISQERSLGDPFQKLFAKVLSVHKHGSGEWGLLAL